MQCLCNNVSVVDAGFEHGSPTCQPHAHPTVLFANRKNPMWSFVLSRDGKDVHGHEQIIRGAGADIPYGAPFGQKQQKQKQQAILLNACIERRGMRLFLHVVNAAFMVWRRGGRAKGFRG